MNQKLINECDAAKQILTKKLQEAQNLFDSQQQASLDQLNQITLKNQEAEKELAAKLSQQEQMLRDAQEALSAALERHKAQLTDKEQTISSLQTHTRQTQAEFNQMSSKYQALEQLDGQKQAQLEQLQLVQESLKQLVSAQGAQSNGAGLDLVQRTSQLISEHKHQLQAVQAEMKSESERLNAALVASESQRTALQRECAALREELQGVLAQGNARLFGKNSRACLLNSKNTKIRFNS
ncbi:Hypothetical_protein [Hexamita inflata]|uniref:Hypothetical_protein n=1 Tax=Hexamita inflata TaxID=28002 RepID=A0AA86RQN2_9EUKA|nr:Hypothetical protein HINF_LOCUS58480 [Hexamita inflata]